ncbi:spore protease YyaC [Halobacillus sp. A1]|uniref:spore protease YyaC n=1 Tax=Halobacillus sp. A1 TaxID=2880262 RepID=UPI0020A6B694|nr:spore protease YyaC [Halobacillus sp. A1]MCP3032187.1 spore protease YyaC [Halobacillus sp. A1]
MNRKDMFSKDEQRFHTDDPLMSEQLSECLNQWLPNQKDVIVICIGTDRSTGDALGPLVGSMLRDQPLKTIHVYGTLEEPVHALNLHDTIKAINRLHSKPLVLAIDACLGKKSSIGSVVLGQGSLSPGAALKKDLPDVGDYHISGMVNVGGFMEYVVLQNTRLHIVMSMAAKIAAALRLTETKRLNEREAHEPYRDFLAATKKQQR